MDFLKKDFQGYLEFQRDYPDFLHVSMNFLQFFFKRNLPWFFYWRWFFFSFISPWCRIFFGLRRCNFRDMKKERTFGFVHFMKWLTKKSKNTCNNYYFLIAMIWNHLKSAVKSLSLNLKFIKFIGHHEKSLRGTSRKFLHNIYVDFLKVMFNLFCS